MVGWHAARAWPAGAWKLPSFAAQRSNQFTLRQPHPCCRATAFKDEPAALDADALDAAALEQVLEPLSSANEMSYDQEDDELTVHVDELSVEISRLVTLVESQRKLKDLQAKVRGAVCV